MPFQQNINFQTDSKEPGYGVFDFDRPSVQKRSVCGSENLSILASQPPRVKNVFLIMYVLGLVLIFTMRTPVKYYQFFDRNIVIHTNIFSDKGKILTGQLVLYIFIWSAFIYLTYLLFKFLKKNK